MKIANVVVRKSNEEPNWTGLCTWLKERRPDIVALQKIGSIFPKKESFLDLGYKSRFLSGPRWYLGVAVLSCQKLPQPKLRNCRLAGAEQDGPRFLTVDIGGFWVSSLYAPYGPLKSKPGDTRPKHERAIERRVAWLNRLQDHIYNNGYHSRDSLLCGDFNVKVRADGPLKQNDKFYSDKEQDALESLMNLDFRDLYREKNPNEKGHTRGYDKRHSEGTSRLHLILASMSLKDHLRSACVDVESKCRPREDAPPLVVDLDVDL